MMLFAAFGDFLKAAHQAGVLRQSAGRRGEVHRNEPDAHRNSGF